MTTDQPNLSDKAEERHSVLGIASLACGLSAFLFLLSEFGLLIFIIFPSLKIDASGSSIPRPFNAIDPNIFLYANCLLILAGIVLGVVGRMLDDHGKNLATIGMVLSIIMGVLFCVGLVWLVASGLDACVHC